MGNTFRLDGEDEGHSFKACGTWYRDSSTF